MKRSIYSRLLSEYLDGELGLAEKRSVEDALRADPVLLAQHQAERRIGLHLASGLPEVRVHPYRFRQRLAQALDQQHGFITPQRAFTGAMSVALVVVGLTFGLFIYQQRMIGSGAMIVATEGLREIRNPVLRYEATLVIESTAEEFYDRLLLESQLGRTDSRVAGELFSQSGVLEGATCIERGGLRTTAFPQPLPRRQPLQLSLHAAQVLKEVADGLTGNRTALALSTAGQVVTQHDYLMVHPAGAPLPVTLIFQD